MKTPSERNRNRKVSECFSDLVSFMIRCAHTQICHVENSLEGPVDSRRDFLHYYRLVMGDENISIIHCI